MKQILLKPEIHKFETCKEFAEQFKLGEGDLIITNEYIYTPFFGSMGIKATVIFQEKYGAGEPSDEMVEAMYADLPGGCTRVIAIGGGTVIDIAKLFALKNLHPVLDLYDRKLEIVKDKTLVLVPTTCGTGSEVTNISILALKSRDAKLGLAVDELYADSAVLIPELLSGLPFRFFATSSIDALVHAVESGLSPKATPYTRLFGDKAIEMIIGGYLKIADDGPEARIPLLEDFLIASSYAGIAFGTAGCAAVHAMSYPLSGKYHVAHGESNYALFTGVLKSYMEVRTDGAIAEINALLARLLGCGIPQVYDRLEELLNNILPKQPLRAYGVTEAELPEFAKSVITMQGRLMGNSFVPLDEARVLKIYRELY